MMCNFWELNNVVMVMQRRVAIFFSFLFFITSLAVAESAAPAVGIIHQASINLEFQDGRVVAATEGLVFVPENRDAPDSRTIAVNFVRIKGSSENYAVPIFLLPGGPGGAYTPKRITSKGMRDHLEVLLETGRDIVVVNQRGNADVYGLDQLLIRRTPQPLDQVVSRSKASKMVADDLAKGIAGWTARGVDLKGYAIKELVKDVDDVRAAFGYNSIILDGTSFGSQWSISYARTFPGRVDRMFLTGLEPLDFAYDDPSWLWNVIERLEHAAKQNPTIDARLPEGGFKAVIDHILDQLEKAPATVQIKDPATDETYHVTVGPFDVQRALSYPWPYGAGRKERTHHWPAFMLRLYDGDYHDLAVRAYRDRTAKWDMLMPYYVDNSLGVTPERDRLLLERAAFSPFGDVNWAYRATREVTTSLVVSDSFRTEYEIKVPVLLLHGDWDLSTPIENIRNTLDHFKQGHLIEVKEATHSVLVEALEMLPSVRQTMLSFLIAPTAVAASEVFTEAPKVLSLPKADFPSPDEVQAYPEWQVKD